MKKKLNQSRVKSQLESALVVATLALTQSACNAISIQRNINDGQDAGIQAPTLEQSSSLSEYDRAMIARGAQVYQGIVVSQLASTGSILQNTRSIARISNQAVTHNSSESALIEGQLAEDIEAEGDEADHAGAENFVAVDPAHLGCALWFRADPSTEGGFLDCTSRNESTVYQPTASDLGNYLTLSMDSNGHIGANYVHDDETYHVSTMGAQVANLPAAFHDGLYHYLQATATTDIGGVVHIQLYVDNHGPYSNDSDPENSIPLELIETQKPAIFSGAADIERLLDKRGEIYDHGSREFAAALNAVLLNPEDSVLSAFCREQLGYAAGNSWTLRLYSESDCNSLGGTWYNNGECHDHIGGSFSTAHAIYNSTCPHFIQLTQERLEYFENESCIGVAVGESRLFTLSECVNDLKGDFRHVNEDWGLGDTLLGECFIFGGGSYSSHLGSINQRCSQN